MGESGLQSFRIGADELNAQPIGPKLLPILMHARYSGFQSGLLKKCFRVIIARFKREGACPCLTHNIKIENFRLFGIPLEFANFLLALFAFAVAYPAVFWRANKLFSFIFSLHLLLHMAAAVYGYLGFSVIYRIQVGLVSPNETIFVHRTHNL